MFRNLTAGDEVTRMLGDGGLLMRMVVVAVEDDFVYCDEAKERPMRDLPVGDHWKFDRDTGVEEDEGLEWGRAFDKSGSRLITASEEAALAP